MSRAFWNIIIFAARCVNSVTE